MSDVGRVAALARIAARLCATVAAVPTLAAALDVAAHGLRTPTAAASRTRPGGRRCSSIACKADSGRSAAFYSPNDLDGGRRRAARSAPVPALNPAALAGDARRGSLATLDGWR